jgi:hypothetical protein
MKDFVRQKGGKALFFNNSAKREEILERRTLKKEVESLRAEINTLRKMIEEHLLKRN